MILPSLKKANLVGDNLSHFHPVTNRLLMGKLMERVVLVFLEETNRFGPLQLGFRPCHGTEIVLACPLDSQFREVDWGIVTLFVLLNLSTISDIVDHDILLDWLVSLTIGAPVLWLLQSFFQG